MPTAEQVLTVARRELGFVEGPDASNKYGAAYGVDRVWWCAQFVWWVFRQAGGSNLIHPKTAYTPTLAQWFMDQKVWGKEPRVGAVVFYDWPDSTHRIQHVGIVEGFDATSITTIEGNTSSGAAGNQSNGNGVYRRRRARNSSVIGYGYPRYQAAPAATEEDELTPEEKKRLADVEAAVARCEATTVRTEQKLDLLLSQLVVGEGRLDEPRTWGWTTWGGGTDEKLTPVDLWRRSNVEVRVANNVLAAARGEQAANLNAMAKQVGELVAEVRNLPDAIAGGPTVVEGPAFPAELQITGTLRPIA
jgi:hypothetical protein